jgi:hypothetical protein
VREEVGLNQISHAAPWKTCDKSAKSLGQFSLDRFAREIVRACQSSEHGDVETYVPVITRCGAFSRLGACISLLLTCKLETVQACIGIRHTCAPMYLRLGSPVNSRGHLSEAESKMHVISTSIYHTCSSRWQFITLRVHCKGAHELEKRFNRTRIVDSTRSSDVRPESPSSSSLRPCSHFYHTSWCQAVDWLWVSIACVLIMSFHARLVHMRSFALSSCVVSGRHVRNR